MNTWFTYSYLNNLIAIQSILPNTRHTFPFQFLSNIDNLVVLSLAVPTRLLTYLSGRFPTASNDISFLSLTLVSFLFVLPRSFPHAPVADVIRNSIAVLQNNSWILRPTPKPLVVILSVRDVCTGDCTLVPSPCIQKLSVAYQILTAATMNSC
jgi:hypothetical protein